MYHLEQVIAVSLGLFVIYSIISLILLNFNGLDIFMLDSDPLYLIVSIFSWITCNFANWTSSSSNYTRFNLLHLITCLSTVQSVPLILHKSHIIMLIVLYIIYVWCNYTELIFSTFNCDEFNDILDTIVSNLVKIQYITPYII